MTDVADDPSQGLRILCFDGGGVRGKASLCMLREIMDRIEPGVKPCDFFDLIAGTSTGALIAIMLARLGYTVSEAIKKYDELSPRIFSSVQPEGVWIKNGTPLVHEGPAEIAFREIGRVGGEDGLMGSGHNHRCKCFVTTVLEDRPTKLVPIRSYPSADRTDPVTSTGSSWKLWQAARAATAAPVYFRSVAVAGWKFIDAGAGYNNPSSEVYHEITRNIPEYKNKRIACFVSIGTGASGARPPPASTLRRLGTFDFSGMKRRATDLVQYLGAIAAATAKVDVEMQRHMENGPYFRFDPGHAVGLINMADISQLERMAHLVWEHVQDNRAVETQLQLCAETLKAASFLEGQSMTSDPGTTDPPPEPALPPKPENRYDVRHLVDIVLNKPEETVRFLLMLSLSQSFDSVLNVLDDLYFSQPLSDTSTAQVCILSLVTRVVTHLWLTDPQNETLSKRFVSNPPPNYPCVAWQRYSLIEALKMAQKEDQNTIEGFITAAGDKYLDVLAEELAEALAVLEDRLRREDPVGECVRWLAKNSPRDFVSFPERVTGWVLQCILLAKPEHMKQNYRLFYKVAQHSKEILNFSAMRAIVAALHSLDKLRAEIKFNAPDLGNMGGLSHAHEIRETQRTNRPYLHSLEDVVKPQLSIDVSSVTTAQQIHWDGCQVLLGELNTFTSSEAARLTSPLEYLFGRNRVVGCVKKGLINVKLIHKVEHEVKRAIRRIRAARPNPPPLFQTTSSSSHSGSFLA